MQIAQSWAFRFLWCRKGSWFLDEISFANPTNVLTHTRCVQVRFVEDRF